MTDEDDDRLIDRLRGIADQVDPPIEPVLAAARAALGTRRLDAQLAELIADSADVAAGLSDHATEPALARGESDGDQVRLLSFEWDAVVIELEARIAGGRASLRGLVTGVTGEVSVQTAAGTQPVPIDDDGWFRVADLVPGRFRLRVRSGDATIVTSWVTL